MIRFDNDTPIFIVASDQKDGICFAICVKCGDLFVPHSADMNANYFLDGTLSKSGEPIRYRRVFVESSADQPLPELIDGHTLNLIRIQKYGEEEEFCVLSTANVSALSIELRGGNGRVEPLQFIRPGVGHSNISQLLCGRLIMKDTNIQHFPDFIFHCEHAIAQLTEPWHVAFVPKMVPDGVLWPLNIWLPCTFIGEIGASWSVFRLRRWFGDNLASVQVAVFDGSVVQGTSAKLVRTLRDDASGKQVSFKIGEFVWENK